MGKPIAIILDGQVLQNPVVQEPILNGKAQITGYRSLEEAHNIAILLRSGALPVPVQIIEYETQEEIIYIVNSKSMEPTLSIGTHLMVDKNYNRNELHRGDIIVFRYPHDPTRIFAKRLISFGGETVALRDNHLYINGQKVSENYLPVNINFANFGPALVPKGTYLVLNDNRNDYEDSRTYGPIPQENVIGKVIEILK
ncbi:MAG: signal peptidase I [Firmicutes bacterium]|nr:signal peptidase I [Bacillota bacterium]